jgi:CelD/BcsL family acetyltransferase involved in cellulose biosynthesis
MNATLQSPACASVVIPWLSSSQETACAQDAESCGSPMRHPLWLKACLETIARETPVRLVTAVAGDSLAVAPLFLRHRSRRLEMPGVEELYEPMDFLHAGTGALPKLAETLVWRKMVIFLRRVPADSPIIPALKAAYGRTGLVVCRQVSGYPYIPLNREWNDPEEKLRPGRASDIRRARRIAQQMGTVSYESHAPAPQELAPLLDEAFNVERRSWKGANGTDLAHDTVRGPFYRAFTAAAAERRILRLGFLRIGGRVAAMQIAVECGNRYWLLKSSYDREFSRCSPGLLLLADSIRRTASSLASFEFLGTAERWTRVWTTAVRPCVSVRAYPEFVPAVASLAFEAARVCFGRIGRAVRSL